MARFKKTKFEYERFMKMFVVVILTIISTITLYDMYLKIETQPDTYVNATKTYENEENKFNIVDELEDLTR